MSNILTNDATTAYPKQVTKPWDPKLRRESEYASHYATDEDNLKLQGAWETAIHRLFQDSDGFQMTLHPTQTNYRVELERTFYPLIKIKFLPVCVFGMRPYSDLKRPQARIAAYKQVEHRLISLLEDDHPTPMIYGVSIIGDRFLIMQMDTKTGLINSALNTQSDVPISDVAPAHLWETKVTKRLGQTRLTNLVNDVKNMVKDIPPRVPDVALAYESDESESDTSSLSFTDD